MTNEFFALVKREEERRREEMKQLKRKSSDKEEEGGVAADEDEEEKAEEGKGIMMVVGGHGDSASSSRRGGEKRMMEAPGAGAGVGDTDGTHEDLGEEDTSEAGIDEDDEEAEHVNDGVDYYYDDYDVGGDGDDEDSFFVLRKRLEGLHPQHGVWDAKELIFAGQRSVATCSLDRRVKVTSLRSGECLFVHEHSCEVYRLMAWDHQQHHQQQQTNVLIVFGDAKGGVHVLESSSNGTASGGGGGLDIRATPFAHRHEGSIYSMLKLSSMSAGSSVSPLLHHSSKHSHLHHFINFIVFMFIRIIFSIRININIDSNSAGDGFLRQDDQVVERREQIVSADTRRPSRHRL